MSNEKSKAMTVDLAILELQKIQAQGFGDSELINDYDSMVQSLAGFSLTVIAKTATEPITEKYWSYGGVNTDYYRKKGLCLVPVVKIEVEKIWFAP